MAGPTQVLIVDDDAILRDMAAVWVRSEGYSVSEAADGQAALEALASGPRVGLIILDLAMPVMDGKTFLAHKARGAHAAIPVIIFSSSPSRLERLPDVIAVVSKGAGIEALLAAISLAVGNGPLPYAPAGGIHG